LKSEDKRLSESIDTLYLLHNEQNDDIRALKKPAE
jgi:hypothetical protein